MADQCPFKVGDIVIFTHQSGKIDFPGEYGIPKVGQRVKITAIYREQSSGAVFIRWEGGENSPGGGIHWTEFSATE